MHALYILIILSLFHFTSFSFHSFQVKKVDDGDGGGNVDDDDDDDDDDDIDFTKRVLIFPPQTLVYGNYEIQLEVQ